MELFRRSVACALQGLMFAVVLRSDSPRLFLAAAGSARTIDLSTLDATVRLPRTGTAGFVQYLDPGELDGMQVLACTVLFARKASAEVAGRLAVEGWAWREAQRVIDSDFPR